MSNEDRSIVEVLRQLATDWAVPRAVYERGRLTDFKFRCVLDERSNDEPQFFDTVSLPADLAEFWGTCSSARLFEDVDFGQWGLVLMAPRDSEVETAELRVDRPRDWRPGDRVVGRFLGDQELLIVRCDPESTDFGQVVIGTPLDGREDWYRPAFSLKGFVENLGRAEGGKYWEELQG